MNDDEKYRKYKNKYLKLLKKKYKNKLLKLYPDIQRLNDDKKYEYETTYGEVNNDGINKLHNIIDENKYNTFIDIGSGNGKVVLDIGCNHNIKKSIGIELVEARHKKAKELYDELSKEFNNVTSKVKLINDDLFNVKLNEIVDNKPIIYISNLCFSNEINNKLFDKLTSELPKGTTILSTKIPEQKYNNLIINNEQITMPATWNKDSQVYVSTIL